MLGQTDLLYPFSNQENSNLGVAHWPYDCPNYMWSGVFCVLNYGETVVCIFLVQQYGAVLMDLPAIGGNLAN